MLLCRLDRLLPFRRLSAQGVMGMNRRNICYIGRYNPRELFPLVDDKLKTKRLALQAGIAVPELYGVIETQHDIRRLPEIVGSHPEFVLKPAHGSAGDGIVVIAGRSGSRYRAINGELFDLERDPDERAPIAASDETAQAAAARAAFRAAFVALDLDPGDGGEARGVEHEAPRGG